MFSGCGVSCRLQRMFSLPCGKSRFQRLKLIECPVLCIFLQPRALMLRIKTIGLSATYCLSLFKLPHTASLYASHPSCHLSSPHPWPPSLRLMSIPPPKAAAMLNMAPCWERGRRQVPTKLVVRLGDIGRCPHQIAWVNILTPGQ